MPTYIHKHLAKLQHPEPRRPQLSPLNVSPFNPQYLGQIQYASIPDTSPLLPKYQIKRIQSIVGSLLYYERSIYDTILTALNTISASQSKPTDKNLAQ